MSCKTTIGIIVFTLGFVCASPSWSQTTTTDLEVLLKEIQSLKEGQVAIQKEIESIKTLIQRPSAPAPAARVTVEPVNLLLDIAGAPSKGAADAKVAVIEFTDFQCPFCARHSTATFPSIENDYVKSGKIKYVVRDFPIPALHPQAAKAAEAAHCAGDQGKYWDMHRQLFANQRKLSPFDLVGYAQTLGLDRQEFESCIDSGKYAGVVTSAIGDGSKGGVTGTPTFFLGLVDPKSGTVKISKRIQGAQPYTVFKEAIEALLNPRS